MYGIMGIEFCLPLQCPFIQSWPVLLLNEYCIQYSV